MVESGVTTVQHINSLLFGPVEGRTRHAEAVMRAYRDIGRASTRSSSVENRSTERGRFTRIDKAAAVEESAASLERPPTREEEYRRKLAGDIHQHVETSYRDHLPRETRDPDSEA